MIYLGKISGAIKSAIEAAKKSTHHQHLHGAIVLRSGNIISRGFNHSANHAEVTALNRAWRSNINGGTLIVVRIRKNGDLADSKPCGRCMAAIIEAGISKIIYSNQDGMLVLQKIKIDNFTIQRHTVEWGNSDVYQFSKIAVMKDLRSND